MYDIPVPIPAKPTRFMDQLRHCIRSKRLAYKTEQTYCHWIAAYIRFHDKKHPASLGTGDVEAFLSYLAVQRNVAINTQKTALNALVFLYKGFLKQDIGTIGFATAKRARRLPVYFSHEEAGRILRNFQMKTG